MLSLRKGLLFVYLARCKLHPVRFRQLRTIIGIDKMLTLHKWDDHEFKGSRQRKFVQEHFPRMPDGIAASGHGSAAATQRLRPASLSAALAAVR